MTREQELEQALTDTWDVLAKGLVTLPPGHPVSEALGKLDTKLRKAGLLPAVYEKRS